MAAATHAPDIPHPPSPDSDNSDSFGSFSTDTDDKEISGPLSDTAMNTLSNIDSLITENNSILARILDRDRANNDRIRALTSEIKAHNDALEERRRTREQSMRRESGERLFRDIKLDRLVNCLYAVKNMTIAQNNDVNEIEKKANEIQQVKELRDVIQQLWLYDQTVLGQRMTKLEFEDDVNGEVGG
ncbi:MAG: hypothetical protein Q9201_006249 [Fulgogasparrea decipioides]